ncbi:phosphatidylinositol mannoside acyltransferase [Corynebacterium epidermidicanis]|uniref:Lauroyl/myristoyl acyltransferase n=1 Tax=Corynebacterium epidermidicanis TaxID=1050174 RepID=A0A0G3GWS6_9CORY|nr:phosphatidylinositol mannoside acyltransferase [Corynebacterium epidermidicanis]AKK03287.1 Lauroyl/myristoyl acyltransferase [Corynebacterium epidermidicanis]
MDRLRQLWQNPVAIGYLAGWRVIGRLPRPVALKLAYCAADIACGDGKGMEQLRRNLTRVVGAEHVSKKLVQASMRSYARYWIEAFQLPRMATDPSLLRALNDSIEGAEHLAAAQTAGKGVVLTLPHSGNWDMAGLWLAQQGGFTTVAEKLKPEVLYEAFVDFRTSLGFSVLAHPTDPAESGPFAQLKAVLEAGGTIALLGERDLKQHGVEVDFFGEPARFPAGPALLAIETGASLHVVDCHFRDNGWGLRISEPLKVTTVPATTQDIANRFADNIKAHPEDWHMLQRIWLADV